MLYLIIFITAINFSIFSQTILSKNWYLFDRNNSPLPSNRITSLVFDWNNNIYWIGCGWEFSGNDTVRGGLARFDGSNWLIINSSNSPILSDAITDLALDYQNRLLIAVFGEGLYRYDGETWEVFNSTNSPLPSNDIQYVSVDKDNNIWLAVFDFGAVKFDGTNWLFFNESNSFIGINDLNFIESDSSGIIWFGSEYNGLYSFNGVNWSREGKGPFLNSISVTYFALDSLFNPWFTGNIHFIGSGVLAHLFNQNWIIYDSSSIGYSTRFAYKTPVVDKKGNKYAGSAIGLFQFDNNNWTLFSSDNSPIPYNIFSVGIKDNNNNKIYGLRAPDPHQTGYVGLIFYNEDSVVITNVNDNYSLEINDYFLYQNYPNPFNPNTIISYQIPITSKVTIKLFDILGREIQTLIIEEKSTGYHTINFDGNNLPSGVYFYSISVNDFNRTKKMILMR